MVWSGRHANKQIALAPLQWRRAAGFVVNNQRCKKKPVCNGLQLHNFGVHRPQVINTWCQSLKKKLTYACLHHCLFKTKTWEVFRKTHVFIVFWRNSESNFVPGPKWWQESMPTCSPLLIKLFLDNCLSLVLVNRAKLDVTQKLHLG